MSKPKASFGASPKRNQEPPQTLEQWVDPKAPESSADPLKRLTIDIPASLHKQFKAKCVAEEANMAELMRKWISDYVSKP